MGEWEWGVGGGGAAEHKNNGFTVMKQFFLSFFRFKCLFIELSIKVLAECKHKPFSLFISVKRFAINSSEGFRERWKG